MRRLSNISKSKLNQKIEFGLLIEHKMINIFLEKSYTRCGGEAIPRPFSKKLKLSISLDQQSEFLISLFYCISKLMNTKIY